MKADVATLRQSVTHDKTAFVLADVYNGSDLLEVAPRNFLKSRLKESANLKPDVGIDFTVSLHKFKKEDD